MKLFFLSLSFVFFTLIGTSQAKAQMCNQRCEMDSDCGSGYGCFVGVCRLTACPVSSTCSCNSGVAATPSPTSTPKASPTPKATVTTKPTASSSATPKPTSTASGTLKNSPKTGAGTWIMAGMAVITFAVSTGIAGLDSIFKKGRSPQEISAKRQQSRE